MRPASSRRVTSAGSSSRSRSRARSNSGARSSIPWWNWKDARRQSTRRPLDIPTTCSSLKRIRYRTVATISELPSNKNPKGLPFMKRTEMLQKARQRTEPWDIIIVGGGATGVGVAVDAATRGYATFCFWSSMISARAPRAARPSSPMAASVISNKATSRSSWKR